VNIDNKADNESSEAVISVFFEDPNEALENDAEYAVEVWGNRYVELCRLHVAE